MWKMQVDMPSSSMSHCSVSSSEEEVSTSSFHSFLTTSSEGRDDDWSVGSASDAASLVDSVIFSLPTDCDNMTAKDMMIDRLQRASLFEANTRFVLSTFDQQNLEKLPAQLTNSSVSSSSTLSGATTSRSIYRPIYNDAPSSSPSSLSEDQRIEYDALVWCQSPPVSSLLTYSANCSIKSETSRVIAQEEENRREHGLECVEEQAFAHCSTIICKDTSHDAEEVSICFPSCTSLSEANEASTIAQSAGSSPSIPITTQAISPRPVQLTSALETRENDYESVVLDSPSDDSSSISSSVSSLSPSESGSCGLSSLASSQDEIDLLPMTENIPLSKTNGVGEGEFFQFAMMVNHGDHRLTAIRDELYPSEEVRNTNRASRVFAQKRRVRIKPGLRAQMVEKAYLCFQDLEGIFYRFVCRRSAVFLNIGCGTSDICKELVLHGYNRVYGVDRNEVAIEFQRQWAQPDLSEFAQFSQMKPVNLLLPDNMCDCIFTQAIMDVIATRSMQDESVDKLICAIDQVVRCLKTGGVWIAVVWYDKRNELWASDDETLEPNTEGNNTLVDEFRERPWWKWKGISDRIGECFDCEAIFRAGTPQYDRGIKSKPFRIIVWRRKESSQERLRRLAAEWYEQQRHKRVFDLKTTWQMSKRMREKNAVIALNEKRLMIQEDEASRHIESDAAYLRNRRDREAHLILFYEKLLLEERSLMLAENALGKERHGLHNKKETRLDISRALPGGHPTNDKNPLTYIRPGQLAHSLEANPSEAESPLTQNCGWVRTILIAIIDSWMQEQTVLTSTSRLEPTHGVHDTADQGIGLETLFTARPDPHILTESKRPTQVSTINEEDATYVTRQIVIFIIEQALCAIPAGSSYLPITEESIGSISLDAARNGCEAAQNIPNEGLDTPLLDSAQSDSYQHNTTGNREDGVFLLVSDTVNWIIDVVVSTQLVGKSSAGERVEAKEAAVILHEPAIPTLESVCLVSEWVRSSVIEILDCVLQQIPFESSIKTSVKLPESCAGIPSCPDTTQSNLSTTSNDEIYANMRVITMWIVSTALGMLSSNTPLYLAISNTSSTGAEASLQMCGTTIPCSLTVDPEIVECISAVVSIVETGHGT